MARDTRHVLFALLRGCSLAGMFGVVALAGSVLAASGCYVVVCDDDEDWDDDDDSHDDDDDCYDDDDDGSDDDDDGSSSSAESQGADDDAEWKLLEYGLVPSQEPGAHAVQCLIDIRGFSLRSKLGPGVYGDDEIRNFTGKVLQANAELLVPPAEQGRLRFDSIDHQQSFILVSYVQELVRGGLVEGEAEIATLVPGATLVFILDLHGRLIEIDSTLRIDVAIAGEAGAVDEAGAAGQ